MSTAGVVAAAPLGAKLSDTPTSDGAWGRSPLRDDDEPEKSEKSASNSGSVGIGSPAFRWGRAVGGGDGPPPSSCGSRTVSLLRWWDEAMDADGSFDILALKLLLELARVVEEGW